MNGRLSLRVLVADGHSLFLDAMRQVLDERPDIEVVAVAGDGNRAITEAERTRPELAVLDANLPNGDGIHATRLIRERVPECRVLLLADGDDDAVLLEGIVAGASGYLTKCSPLTELIEAANSIRRGEAPIPGRMLPGLLTRLVGRRQQQDEVARRMAGLSHRERQVLGLLAGGAEKDDIARALVISPETARTHIQNVLAKLGVHSRLEAASIVVRGGLQEELLEAVR